MDTLADASARILDLEARQDEALRQLIQLEKQIDEVLAHYSPTAIVATSNEPSIPQVKAA